MLQWIKKLFTKNKKESKQNIIDHDPWAPRKNNVIYPNDKFAQGHINRWLDDVLDKHHG